MLMPTVTTLSSQPTAHPGSVRVVRMGAGRDRRLPR